jgi:hypothetical protein
MKEKNALHLKWLKSNAEKNKIWDKKCIQINIYIGESSKYRNNSSNGNSSNKFIN